MEKGGGGGCCNTATYSTGEEALAVDGERGKRRKEGRGKGERKAAKGKKAEGVVAVIQQHTQRERKPWLWMERGERGERREGEKAKGRRRKEKRRRGWLL